MIQPGFSCAEGAKLVTLSVTQYDEFNAVSWKPVVTGDGKTMVRELLDCDVVLPLPEAAPRKPGHRYDDTTTKITSQKGCDGAGYRTSGVLSAEEFRLEDDYLAQGEKRHFECRGGRSSDMQMPIFDVRLGDTGYIIAIGWTGGWRADFERVPEGVRVRAGLKETAFVLPEGETVHTGSVLVLAYADGERAGRNRFRRLLNQYYNPGEGMLSFESWGGLPSATIIERLKRLEAHKVPFEYHWIDAGWHGDAERASLGNFDIIWAWQTGDWRVNPRIHPALMRDIRDETEKAGMKMMLWVEPERVIASTPAAIEHPEYFLEWPGADKNDPHRNLLLDLSREDVYQSTLKTLTDLIRDLRIGCYRQDFNCEPWGAWELADAQNGRGLHEIRHINNLYRLWDAIHEQFPGIMIDNCASGGRRIDIESMRRAMPYFRSDYQCMVNADPNVTQAHQAGVSHFWPSTGCTTKTKADTYAARSTYSAGWGAGFWSVGTMELSDDDLEWTRGICEEYKALRPYFTGDYYSLGCETVDPAAWAAWIYWREAEDDGLLMVFRREKSPMTRAIFPVDATRAGAAYVARDIDTGAEIPVVGGEIQIDMPSARSCRIFKIYAQKRA